MDIFDQILENLELERELGVRTVEIDRALLVPLKSTVTPGRSADPAPTRPEPRQSVPSAPAEPAASSVPETAKVPAAPVKTGPACDIAFFTGRPLSARGTEAMEKIFAAIDKIRPGAVLAMNEERAAKVCVLLGSEALRQRVPAARPMRGAWTALDGVPAIMTFSPDYIFSHFQDGSPRMKDAKTVMWNDIKSAGARLG